MKWVRRTGEYEGETLTIKQLSERVRISYPTRARGALFPEPLWAGASKLALALSNARAFVPPGRDPASLPRRPRRAINHIAR
jgi:hypothetical protein